MLDERLASLPRLRSSPDSSGIRESINQIPTSPPKRLSTFRAARNASVAAATAMRRGHSAREWRVCYGGRTIDKSNILLLEYSILRTQPFRRIVLQWRGPAFPTVVAGPRPHPPDWRHPMRLRISAKQTPLPGDLRQKIQRRAQFALGRFGSQVQSLSVHLADENAHKGGVDKTCRVSLILGNGQRLVVSQAHSELVAAIDLGLERMGERVARHISRGRPRRGHLSMSGQPS